MAELESKLAKAARDYDKLCSGLYDKRTAILKSADGDGPAVIPDFWLGVLQAMCDHAKSCLVARSQRSRCRPTQILAIIFLKETRKSSPFLRCFHSDPC